MFPLLDSILHHHPQFFEPEEDAAFECAERNLQAGGNLFVRVPFELTEFDGGALLGGQMAQEQVQLAL